MDDKQPGELEAQCDRMAIVAAEFRQLSHDLEDKLESADEEVRHLRNQVEAYSNAIRRAGPCYACVSLGHCAPSDIKHCVNRGWQLFILDIDRFAGGEGEW